MGNTKPGGKKRGEATLHDEADESDGEMMLLKHGGLMLCFDNDQYESKLKYMLGVDCTRFSFLDFGFDNRICLSRLVI